MAIRLIIRLLRQHFARRDPEPSPARALPLHVPQSAIRPAGRTPRASLLALAALAVGAAVLAVHLLGPAARREAENRVPATLRLDIPHLSAAPAIVFLTGPGLASAVPARDSASPPQRITSRAAAFTPSFQVLPPGSVIEVVNDDAIPHNTHVFNGGETVFNVALPLAGVSVRKTLTGSGIFSVRCDLHPWMQAWLFVPPSRHHESLHQPATVTFTGIDPGQVLLHLWQPGQLESIHPLTLSPGTTRTLRLR